MSTGPSAVDVLNDVPAQRWDALARAVRRAVDQLTTAQVPVAVRPFSTFKPEALRDASHARRAVAEALVRDLRFREAVAETVADGPRRAWAARTDPLALRAEVGADQAVALLAVSGRWRALATLVAVLAEEAAAQEAAAAESASSVAVVATAQLQDELRRLRRDLQDAERRETDLRRLVQQLVSERDAAQAVADEARAAHRDLTAALDAERAEHRERLARARRRAAEARQWAASSDARTEQVLAELSDLAARLRAVPSGGADAAGEGDVVAVADRRPPAGGDAGAATGNTGTATGNTGTAAGDAGTAAGDAEVASAGIADAVAGGAGGALADGVVPHRVRTAAPGRPSRLPAGVDPDSASAVTALLQVPGQRLFIDGYNVTKDARGVPGLPLEQQRRWLVRLVNGVVARFDVRPTVVFDGRADVGGEVPRARGVIVCFSADDSADDVLADMLGGLDPDAPAVVVSSDREVRAAALARGVNSVAAEHFIAAVAG